MGITVTVPNVNDSFADFAPSRSADKTISFGMAAVRNVGESLVDKIVAEREANGLFESIYDFVRRVDPIVLNKRSMESLIKSGAFDCFELSRQGLLLVHEELVATTLERRRDIQQGISSLFSMLDESAGDWSGTDIPVPAHEFDRTAKMGFEREMLGLFISDHPLAGHERTLSTITDCSIADLRANFEEDKEQTIVREIGGLVVDLVVKTAQSGKQFAKVVLEDLSGVIEFMVFGKTFTEYGHLLSKDATVVVKVRCDERNDEIRVTALNVSPANLSGAPASALRLKMVGRLAQPAGISELKALLGQYPGDTPVTLIVESTRKSFQLGPEFAVDLPKVVGPLRSAFGSQCIA
jgi:DNA polymerase-3 subunit alpha